MLYQDHKDDETRNNEIDTQIVTLPLMTLRPDLTIDDYIKDAAYNKLSEIILASSLLTID